MAIRRAQAPPPRADIPAPAPSFVAIQGHPLHPMLVPLPIGALVFLLATDVGYWSTGDAFWATASLWLVGAAVITGLIAGLVGAGDFVSIRRARQLRAGKVHAIGNGVVIVLAILSWYLRADDPAAAVLPWGLLISAVSVLLLGVTGWMGGELSYRHRIGVLPGETATGSAVLDAQPASFSAVHQGDPLRRPDRAGA